MIAGMPRKPPSPDSLLCILGRRIRDRRLAVGLTQPELAAVIGHSQRMISYYETGRREPTVETIARICHAVDMPISTFMSALDDYAAAVRDVAVPKNPKLRRAC